MVLSDTAIRSLLMAGDIVVQPLDLANAIQPASVDIRLGYSFATPDYDAIARRGCVSMGTSLPYLYKNLSMDKNDDSKFGFVLEPKSFVLATTMEYIRIPNNLAARVDGRSSIGRMGLFIQNAGWIDPGFEGEITLELFNALNVPILLQPGRRVGQIIFHTLEGEVENPYRGKYQCQKGATGSCIHLDEELRHGTN